MRGFGLVVVLAGSSPAGCLSPSVTSSAAMSSARRTTSATRPPARASRPSARRTARVDGHEQCDPVMMNSSVACTDLGFYADQGAVATCTTTCLLDMSACTQTCGDHIKNGPGVLRRCAARQQDLHRLRLQRRADLACSSDCGPRLDDCTAIGRVLRGHRGPLRSPRSAAASTRAHFAMYAGGALTGNMWTSERTARTWTKVAGVGLVANITSIWAAPATDDVFATVSSDGSTISHFTGGTWTAGTCDRSGDDRSARSTACGARSATDVYRRRQRRRHRRSYRDALGRRRRGRSKPVKLATTAGDLARRRHRRCRTATSSSSATAASRPTTITRARPGRCRRVGGNNAAARASSPSPRCRRGALAPQGFFYMPRSAITARTPTPARADLGERERPAPGCRSRAPISTALFRAVLGIVGNQLDAVYFVGRAGAIELRYDLKLGDHPHDRDGRDLAAQRHLPACPRRPPHRRERRQHLRARRASCGWMATPSRRSALPASKGERLATVAPGTQITIAVGNAGGTVATSVATASTWSVTSRHRRSAASRPSWTGVWMSPTGTPFISTSRRTARASTSRTGAAAGCARPGMTGTDNIQAVWGASTGTPVLGVGNNAHRGGGATHRRGRRRRRFPASAPDGALRGSGATRCDRPVRRRLQRHDRALLDGANVDEDGRRLDRVDLAGVWGTSATDGCSPSGSRARSCTTDGDELAHAAQGQRDVEGRVRHVARRRVRVRHRRDLSLERRRRGRGSRRPCTFQILAAANRAIGDAPGDDVRRLVRRCRHARSPEARGPETHCADGWDNDFDGLVDCADPDCATDTDCTIWRWRLPHRRARSRAPRRHEDRRLDVHRHRPRRSAARPRDARPAGPEIAYRFDIDRRAACRPHAGDRAATRSPRRADLREHRRGATSAIPP